jgi:hypothetical protein
MLHSQSQSQSHITTDGQPVSISWCRAQSGTFDQSFFFLLQSYCLVVLGRPLWREVGSVSCQSLSLESTIVSQYIQTNKLHGLSPRANYTDRATAACRRSDCQLLRIKRARGQRDESLRKYSRVSRQEPLLFYQVAPQLYSRGWVDPVPDPLLDFLLFFPRKSGSAGNRTRASGSVAKNSDH